MTRADLLKDYRAAFLRHLSRRDERTLTQGYDLGRHALADGHTLLDLVQVHHEVLAEVTGAGGADPAESALAASYFLVEVLASFEMVQRSVATPASE